MTPAKGDGQGIAALAGLGLSLIPIRPNSKQPVGPFADGQWTIERTATVLDAHPGAGVAVRAGSASSGLFVVDVDTHGVDGRDFMAGYERQNGKLPKTLTAITPSGGVHLHYRVPDGMPVPRNSANTDVGVDIRGENGYALCPPSPGYSWVPGRGPGEVPIAVADANAMRLVAAVSRSGAPSGRDASGPTLVAEGGRNDACFRFGCSMRARGATDDEAAVMVCAYNAFRCVPPLPQGEVEQIVANVCEYDPGEDVAAQVAGLPHLGAPERGVEAHA